VGRAVEPKLPSQDPQSEDNLGFQVRVVRSIESVRSRKVFARKIDLQSLLDYYKTELGLSSVASVP
jgi:hypothetical protein